MNPHGPLLVKSLHIVVVAGKLLNMCFKNRSRLNVFDVNANCTVSVLHLAKSNGPSVLLGCVVSLQYYGDSCKCFWGKRTIVNTYRYNELRYDSFVWFLVQVSDVFA